MTKLEIYNLDVKDSGRVMALANSIGGAAECEYISDIFKAIEDGEAKSFYIAMLDGRDAGYCVLNYEPKYLGFKLNSIPEIQGLAVHPDMRRAGIGSALVSHCEDIARAAGHKTMGIAFGLHGGFGASQRLYVRAGYVPDGNGITYDRSIVTEGEFRPVDDQLCLMLTKDL